MHRSMNLCECWKTEKSACMNGTCCIKCFEFECSSRVEKLYPSTTDNTCGANCEAFSFSQKIKFKEPAVHFGY